MCVCVSPEIGRLSLIRLLHYQPKRPKGGTREGSKKHAVNKKAKRKKGTTSDLAVRGVLNFRDSERCGLVRHRFAPNCLSRRILVRGKGCRELVLGTGHGAGCLDKPG